MIKIVDGLLDYVPGKFYVGLGEIHLTDSSMLSRSKSFRKTMKQQVRNGQAKALYWPVNTRGPARIEMVAWEREEEESE